MDTKRLIELCLVVIIGIALFVAGCSKNSEVTQVGTPSDQEALRQQVDQLDTAITEFSASDEATIDDNGLQDPDYDGMFAAMPMEPFPNRTAGDSIYPVRWGRHIDWNNIVRDYHVVTEGDTVVFVTITKTIPGQFRVAWGTRVNGIVTVDTVISKPFSENVVRKVRFRRIAHSNDPFKNWVPVAITMVDGKTSGVNAFTIDSLQISENQIPFSTTIIDPVNSWFHLGLLHGTIPIFPVRDSVYVKLMITSTDTLNEIVFVRHGIGGGHLEHRRTRMHLVSAENSSGVYMRVYEGWFRTGLPWWAMLAARFNATVDVVSRGSIYSMTAPFSNEFWGVPYIVAR